MMKFLLLIIIILPKIVFAKNFTIVTTVKPVYNIINGIIGNKQNQYLLVDKNSSIHDYNIKTNNIKAINNSELIFLVSYDLEVYMRKIIKSVNTRNKEVVELAKLPNIKLLPTRSDDILKDDHDHSHSYYDYHIWLDVENTITMIENIKNIIIKKDKNNRDFYQENAMKMISKIRELDSNFHDNFKSLKQVPYITSHNAYQYFEKRYNLHPVTTLNIEKNHNISLKKLKEINQTIHDNKVKCFFTEQNSNDESTKKLIDNDNIHISYLDAEWGNDDMSVNGYYGLLENISKNFTNCFNS